MGRMKELSMELAEGKVVKGANGLPIWVTVKVPVTKAEATRYLGKRCKDYTKGCATCDGWRLFDKTGHVPVLVGRDELLGGVR